MPGGLVCPTDDGGESVSVPARMNIKWCLNVNICLSATFILWFPGGTISQLMLLLSISF